MRLSWAGLVVMLKKRAIVFKVDAMMMMIVNN